MEHPFQTSDKWMKRQESFKTFSKSMTKWSSLVLLVARPFNELCNNNVAAIIARLANTELPTKTLMYRCFFCLITGLILLGIFSVPNQAHASSKVALLVGNRDSGSYQFAEELARLWDMPHFQQQTSLVPVAAYSSEQRLKQLSLRQGDFAIVDPATAFAHLKDSPEISAVSVLWPNALHAISPNVDFLEIDAVIPPRLYVHENSEYFSVTWNQAFSFEQSDASQITWFDSAQASTLLSNLDDGVFLVTAPYPLLELEALFTENTELQLIPLDERLLSGNRQNFPWITNRLLPARVYSNLLRPIQLSTSYPVLLTRSDTPPAIVEAMLAVLFSQQSAVRPHALFRFLDPQNNFPFAKHFRFHPVAQKHLRLQED